MWEKAIASCDLLALLRMEEKGVAQMEMWPQAIDPDGGDKGEHLSLLVETWV